MSLFGLPTAPSIYLDVFPRFCFLAIRRYNRLPSSSSGGGDGPSAKRSGGNSPVLATYESDFSRSLFPCHSTIERYTAQVGVEKLRRSGSGERGVWEVGEESFRQFLRLQTFNSHKDEGCILAHKVFEQSIAMHRVAYPREASRAKKLRNDTPVQLILCTSTTSSIWFGPKCQNMQTRCLTRSTDDDQQQRR